jgi:8-oxo-dGTP pyrophosphatase MutT (NUDIX family)
VRRADLARHAGQISLPGGLVDPGETEAQAALRELEEELSTPAECVEIVGQLTPVFVFNSDSWVVPWVAVAADRPPLNLNPSEVDDLLEVPVDHLLGPAHRGTHEEARGSVRFAAPHFQFGPHRIWGATAMILSELLAVWTDAVGD